MLNVIKKTGRMVRDKVLSREIILRHSIKSLANKAVVLMYHEIAEDDAQIDAWTVVRKSDFIRQMEFLFRHFEIVSLKDAVERVRFGLKSGKPLAVVTFDDGYAGNYRILPELLESLRVPAAIFVATGAVQDQKLYWYDRVIQALQTGGIKRLKHRFLGEFEFNRHKGASNWARIEKLLSELKKINPDERREIVEEVLKEIPPERDRISYSLKPMSIEEIRQIGKNRWITIGAHSHCHNLLTQLSENQIRESVRLSRQLLEFWTGQQITYFAYPNGNFNNQVIQILKEEGLECGLTTIGRPWEKMDSIFSVPRIGVGRYDSLDFFKIRVSNGFN